MHPLTQPAPSANPYLRALRDELEKHRASLMGRSFASLLDALDRHCAEQDRRIAALERMLQVPK